MISISGYMYDATLGVPIDTSLRTYTIGCMSDYSGGVVAGLSGTSAYYAALHIRNSNPGELPLAYVVTDPTSGISVSGVMIQSNFVYDSNNVLVWLNKYYDMLTTQYSAPHTIRFCRSSDPDEWYLELNYDIHGNNVILYTNGQTVVLSGITFRTSDYSVYMFDYSDTIAGNKPTGAYETFYIGSIRTGSSFAVYKCTTAALPYFSVNDNTYIADAIGELGTMIYTNTPTNVIRHIRKTTVKRVIYIGMEHFYATAQFSDMSLIAVIAPDGDISNGEVHYESVPAGPGGSGDSTVISFTYNGHTWLCTSGYAIQNDRYGGMTISNNHIYDCGGTDRIVALQNILSSLNAVYHPATSEIRLDYYAFLIFDPRYYDNPEAPEEPGSDVNPGTVPPADEPMTPIAPDSPDPYYDPSSDPDSPQYDPTKDPSSPQYDPDTPHPPFNPPSTEGGGGEPDTQPPEDEIPAPETPPSYVTTNALFTLYNPSGADLTNLANFLWSPTWSIDTFKKIFANPLDCILGLMVMPYLAVDVGTKNMAVGNIDTGVAMRYFTKQFYDYDCGDFTIAEFYKAYLDYAPYTKVSIFLPYIGDQQLNTDEVMGKTLNVKYRFDLATGDCVAFISVDGSVFYSFSGNCAARLPLSSNNYGGLLPSITGALVAAGSVAAGVPALGAASALAVSSMKQDIRHTGSISGSAGLMGVQTPYLIITRPRQALPIGQNSFTGYPSFITESLGGLTGYTEVESCHLEHVPCTDEELREIENLLKGGVLF